MILISALLILFQTPVTVTHSDIENAVTAYIAEHLGEKNGSYNIEFRNVPKNITLESNTFNLEVNPDRGIPLRGNISLPVDIISEGRIEKRVIVSLRVRRFSDVYLTAATLRRHSEISGDDVVSLRVETTGLPDDIIMDAEKISNKRANRLIQEGVILRESMIEDIPLIRSGSAVNVRIRSGNVLITTTAIARDDGAHGDIISIQRSDTHTRLRARVIDSDNVELVNEREAR